MAFATKPMFASGYGFRTLASYLPSIGSFGNGVSNVGLMSGIASTSVSLLGNFSQPTINTDGMRGTPQPMLVGSNVHYNGTLERNGTYSRGTLTTNDYYSDGSIVSHNYNANSGPWGTRLISRGNNPIYFGGVERTNQLGYVRDGVGWKARTRPNNTMQIHPDEAATDGGRPHTGLGTGGCIGIIENAYNLNLLYDFLYSRTRSYGEIDFYVNY